MSNEVGAIKILVRTGAGDKELTKYNSNEFSGKWVETHPDYIAKDLEDAINWLIG